MTCLRRRQTPPHHSLDNTPCKRLEFTISTALHASLQSARLCAQQRHHRTTTAGKRHQRMRRREQDRAETTTALCTQKQVTRVERPKSARAVKQSVSGHDGKRGNSRRVGWVLMCVVVMCVCGGGGGSVGEKMSGVVR